MIADPNALPATTEHAFPVWGGPAERLRFFLSYAVLAPSRNNAQPWAFEIEGDEVLVFADTSRSTPAADPDGRDLVMGCGAAILNLRVAAAHFGHATSLEIPSGPRLDGLLARIRLEERRASTPELEELFRAIPRRRTNRLPLDGRDPPPGLVTRLAREARLAGVWLRPVDDPQRPAVSELIADADLRQWSDPRFRAEVAAWERPNGTRSRDGVPGWAKGMSDAAARVHPLLVRFRNPASAEAERDRRRALGTKALVVLGTARDGVAEWLAAGEALQRVLLRAADAGLYASYFCQPIAIAELRRALGEVLGERGAPQIMLRLGYGLEVRPTPRRTVDEVLRRMEARFRRPAAPLAVRTPPPFPVPTPQPAAR